MSAHDVDTIRAAYEEFARGDAVAVLAITVMTFWLFASERLPIQTSALLAVLALMLVFGIFPYASEGRELGPEVFLAGFGHTALITICCLMVLGRGLVATGALEPFARLLARLWNFTPQFAFLMMLVFCMAVSGMLNDTPIVVLMMPVLLSVAARTDSSASHTLLPMNYAVLIGGMGLGAEVGYWYLTERKLQHAADRERPCGSALHVGDRSGRAN